MDTLNTANQMVEGTSTINQQTSGELQRQNVAVVDLAMVLEETVQLGSGPSKMENIKHTAQVRDYQ